MAASVTTLKPDKIGPAVLSLDVRHHLGQRLAAAYSQADAEPSLDHFSDLLARLDAALAEAKGSDERAFRVGLMEAIPSLFKFAMSLSRNRTTADDLVQETMMRAWRSRQSFEAGTNLCAWLFTIMRNAFYTVSRKHSHEVADSDGDHAARLASLPEQSGYLDLQDVQAAIDRLPPPMREALMLITVENVSYEDAARIMNCRDGDGEKSDLESTATACGDPRLHGGRYRSGRYHAVGTIRLSSGSRGVKPIEAGGPNRTCWPRRYNDTYRTDQAAGLRHLGSQPSSERIRDGVLANSRARVENGASGRDRSGSVKREA